MRKVCGLSCSFYDPDLDKKLENRLIGWMEPGIIWQKYPTKLCAMVVPLSILLIVFILSLPGPNWVLWHKKSGNLLWCCLEQLHHYSGSAVFLWLFLALSAWFLLSFSDFGLWCKQCCKVPVIFKLNKSLAPGERKAQINVVSDSYCKSWKRLFKHNLKIICTVHMYSKNTCNK